MAKTLKDFLNERQLGPMVVKNPDEQKFIDKHVVAKTDDRNGNDDEVFKGSKVKMADRPKHRKGYNPGQDEEVYEALKGAQHKVDANKNGKVDAHDFHLLRKKKKVAEEAEELEELSKGTLGSYIKKASDNKAYHDRAAGRGIASDGDADEIEAHLDKSDNRKAGINRAAKKLTKEEADQIDELSTDTLRNYRAKAKDDAYDAADVDDDRRLRKRSMGSWDAGKKILKRGDALRKEEAEELDELSKSTMGAYTKKAAADFSARKPKMGYDGQLKKMQNRTVGVNRALDKMYGEEAEQVDEKLDMKKASMGTVVKDFQKSDAPQFQGKSQKKRQVMAIAAKLSAERGGKPLNKEERLLAKLADISETHKRTMVSVFEKLNEDNQREFMLACDTAEGIEQMLDFSISHRGE